MQRTAVAQLVLTLTDSTAFVTLAFAVYALPALVVGSFGSALADRLNRKHLMLGVQAFSAASTLLLALLVMSGLENLCPVGPVALGLMVDSIGVSSAIGIWAVVVLGSTALITTAAPRLWAA